MVFIFMQSVLLRMVYLLLLVEAAQLLLPLMALHGKYQEQEKKRTGISTLKVSYNKVFGYYLEVTNVHKDKVPENYIRKQTLVNAERYITPELKEWEEKILGAEEKMNAIEYEIFQDVPGGHSFDRMDTKIAN